jgi:cysteinyl-tRNA synthetase
LFKKGYSGRDVRFFLLGLHYRKPLNYSEEAIETARNNVKKLDMFICRLKSVHDDGKGYADVDQLIYDLKNGFAAALDDDLNIAGALAVLFDFIGKINSPLSRGTINKNDSRKILVVLENINEVIGVMNFDVQPAPKEILELIEKREAARKVHNWQKADILRSELAGLKVEVLDMPQGTVWHYR